MKKIGLLIKRDGQIESVNLQKILNCLGCFQFRLLKLFFCRGKFCRAICEFVNKRFRIFSFTLKQISTPRRLKKLFVKTKPVNWSYILEWFTNFLSSVTLNIQCSSCKFTNDINPSFPSIFWSTLILNYSQNT